MGLSALEENAAAATIAEAECAVEDGIIGDVVDSADVELVKTVDGNENVDERETKSSEVDPASTATNGVVVRCPRSLPKLSSSTHRWVDAQRAGGLRSGELQASGSLVSVNFITIDLVGRRRRFKFWFKIAVLRGGLKI